MPGVRASSSDGYRQAPSRTTPRSTARAEAAKSPACAVLIRAAAAHLAVILDHAAGLEDYFCAVTIDFWDEFDDGGLVTPRFLYANPAREFFQNVRLLPGTSGYSRFTEECLESADYVVNDQPSPSRQDAGVEAVWVQHVSCQVPPEVVTAGRSSSATFAR